MQEIECPHCDESILLDDGEFGLFTCPYCDGEFEWDMPDEHIKKQLEVQLVSVDTQPRGVLGGIMLTLRTALGSSFFAGGGVIFAIGIMGILFSSESWGSLTSDSTTDGLGGMGVLIIMAIIALGFLVSGGISIIGLIMIIAGIVQIISVYESGKKRT
tara:strand:- start:372 stop:845 length:474 start_codon:yes stop_codon:yes gene_type:complete